MTKLGKQFEGNHVLGVERRGLQRSSVAAFVSCLLVALVGCGSSDDGAPVFGKGTGGSGPGPINPGTGGGGIVIPNGGAGGLSGSSGSGGGCNPRAVGLLRDFKAEHPDFEEQVVTETGIVGMDLGANKKPVFTGMGLKSVTTAANFDQWYNDSPPVNMTYEHTIDFTTGANGRGVYDNRAFFPLDGRGFGNEGRNHNFHFTFELHMEFKYNGGEVFTFRGDDDLWVFVNNKLGIDLGGVHGALEGTLDLDANAARLGIAPGNVYALDFFQAERHTSESNFRIETNLEFTNCDPIIVR
jgi:fibro-slime domain-containing protein